MRATSFAHVCKATQRHVELSKTPLRVYFKLQIADYKLLVVVLSVLRGKVVTIIGAGRIGSSSSRL